MWLDLDTGTSNWKAPEKELRVLLSTSTKVLDPFLIVFTVVMQYEGRRESILSHLRQAHAQSNGIRVQWDSKLHTEIFSEGSSFSLLGLLLLLFLLLPPQFYLSFSFCLPFTFLIFIFTAVWKRLHFLCKQSKSCSLKLKVCKGNVSWCSTFHLLLLHCGKSHSQVVLLQWAWEQGLLQTHAVTCMYKYNVD